jgi:quercetin dioxygenase-like cupin family protein
LKASNRSNFPQRGSEPRDSFTHIKGRKQMKHKIVLAVGLLLAGSALGLAQDMRPPINADDVKWGPVPPNIPAGAQIAVISGDPGKEGLYVIRLKMPAGYKVPAHWHPQYENVTVLTGEFNVGMGDKLDTSKGMALRPGGYVEAPAKMHHYGWIGNGEAIVQVTGPGPFGITYVDPADDPSKK